MRASLNAFRLAFVVLAVPALAAQDLPAARRLLHAAGGGVLRAESRCTEGRWEYRRERETTWTPLSPGVVVAARLESEALDEWRGKRAASRRAAAGERVAACSWALDEGLLKEALEGLDEVLLADPDQPEALALLHGPAVPLAMPADDQEALVQYASAAPPAVRELAVARMLELPDRAALRAALLGRLAGRTSGERAAAALGLRRAWGEEAPAAAPELQELLLRAVRDVSPDVRHAAALALRDAHEEGLILPLVTALGSTSAAIRTDAAEALGLMGYTAAVPALVERLVTLPAAGGGGGYSAPRSHVFVGRQIGFVQGFDVDVAQNAAIGDPEIGTLQEGATLDVAVFGISGPGYSAESTALRGSLERLTGAKPGSSVAAWKSWWQENKAQWAPATTSGG